MCHLGTLMGVVGYVHIYLNIGIYTDGLHDLMTPLGSTN